MASSREDGELIESGSSSSEEDSEEEQSSSAASAALKFKNDGSFLEMFKKMQDSKQQPTQEADLDKSTQPQLKNAENKEGTSHSNSPVSKEAVPVQQKKPGLMSIVSSPPNWRSNSVVELVKLAFLFQG